MNDKLKIFTFHPFEKSIIKDIFFKKSIDLEVALFNFKENYIPTGNEIFIGTCAGNNSLTSLGNLHQVKEIITENEAIKLSPKLELLDGVSCTFTQKPIMAENSDLKTVIAEMESYNLYKNFGGNLTMFRVVTDFGFDEKISIKEYKKEIEKYYRKGIEEFSQLILSEV